MVKFLFILIFLISNFLVLAQNEEKFTLCPGKSYPYYHPALTYLGGFWKIKKHYSNYPKEEWKFIAKNTGIIIIKFKVNCTGETGDFIANCTDMTYKKSTLDKKIIDYFIKKTKELSDWIPAKNSSGHEINSHKFFSFRLLKGELVEILPK
ncbi:MAG: hypothetical protein ACJARP_001889 [Vicingaceae bacterium]|jgi:hypothetical protein